MIRRWLRTLTNHVLPANAGETLWGVETRYRQLFESNIIGFVVVDWEGRVLQANDAFLQLLGYDRQDLAEGRVGGQAMTPPEYRATDEWARIQLRETGVCPPMEKEYIRKDGTRVSVLVGVVFHQKPEQHLVCLVMDGSGRRNALTALRKAYEDMESRVAQRTLELAAANLGLTREIERRKRAEAAFQAQALTDPLTGLYNRRGFVTLATQLRKQASRARHPFLVILADLDGLKVINDTYGHLEGDQAVKATASILRDTFRASDVIARFGGDEFAIAVVEDLNESERKPLLERLQEKIADYNARLQKPYELNLSVGTAEIEPHENQTLVFLIGQADKGLYEVKQMKKTSRADARARSSGDF